ncbi:MAG: hypothetical protein LBL39_00460, partial [Planctomycetaceae bacterium]|nr:hypothetical protein [Planctomycetaceae bacterium]
RKNNIADTTEKIAKVYFACKGECDERLQTVYCKNSSYSTVSWAAISDLVIPSAFLERIVVLLGQVGREGVVYESEAFDAEIYLFRALAQRTLRPATTGETLRTKRMLINGE